MISSRFCKIFRLRFFFALALIPIVATLSSCFDRGPDPALSKEVAEKQQRFEGLKRDLTAKNEELRSVSEEISELESATRNLQRLQKQELEVTKEFNDLKKYEEEVKAAVAVLDGNLSAWRSATRISLVGLNLPVVDLGGGKVLEDAVVVEVLDDSVRLGSQGSELVVEFSKLPSEVRQMLGDESLVIQKLQIERSKK